MSNAFFTITQIPVSKNLYLYPNGAYHSGCSIVGDISNYLCVDDDYDMPDETTYCWMVDTSVVTDMYQITNHTSETGNINYVQVYARARAYTYPLAPTAYYRILAYYSGTTSRAVCNITTDWNTNSYLLNSTPSGGAWNWNAIDNLQIGWDAYSPLITGTVAYEILRPDGDGTHQYWDTFDYHNVDDIIYDEDTTKDTWVHGYTGETTRCNSYHLADHTVLGTIQALIVYYRAKTAINTDAFVRSYVSLTGVSVGGTYNTLNQGCYYATYSDRYSLDPGGGAWSWADIDAIEIGCQLKTFYSGFSEYDYRLTQIYAVAEYLTNVYPQIQTTQMYAMVNYTPSTASCYLSRPHTYMYTNNQNIFKFNTWNQERKVIPTQRASKSLVLMGQEYYHDGVTAETRLNCVRAMKDNGTKVILTDIGDDLIDNLYWLIEDFTYNKNCENPYVYDWTLTLERYENV